MIPKIIHYCWFGRAPLPDKAKKCIDSWRKHCPDYTILEWNEDNFDIHQNGYTEMCCKEKKYAFLADYVRLQIIENEGGFYFDVDVELVRSLDPLCSEHAFFAFETDRMIATGLGFGAENTIRSCTSCWSNMRPCSTASTASSAARSSTHRRF